LFLVLFDGGDVAEISDHSPSFDVWVGLPKYFQHCLIFCPFRCISLCTIVFDESISTNYANVEAFPRHLPTNFGANSIITAGDNHPGILLPVALFKIVFAAAVVRNQKLGQAE